MKIRESIYFLGEIAAIIFVVGIVVFYGTKNKISDVKNVEKTELTMKNMREIRIALEKYYQLTGKYPDLIREGANDNLRILDHSDSQGKKISFADIYGKERLASTPETEGIAESNKVYDVQNFKKGNLKGGWNLNYGGNSGEIHANLPKNAYNQNIDWEDE
ncbi:MAG: hypothetical protein ACRCU6_00365 [Fusobacteriaceae bacterium]